jgi:hypoxanthine phosphoribosyltransferase
MLQIHDKKFVPYLLDAQIQEAIQKIATQIQQAYTGKSLYLLGVLNGSFRLVADLVRALDLPVEVGFIRLSSYVGTDSSGEVSVQMNLPTDMAGKHVIVVEDIIDTGLTLHKLLQTLQEMPLGSCKTFALLSKPTKLRVPLKADYVCFEIPDAFVVGYGLDYDGLGRELNDIYQLADV